MNSFLIGLPRLLCETSALALLIIGCLSFAREMWAQEVGVKAKEMSKVSKSELSEPDAFKNLLKLIEKKQWDLVFHFLVDSETNIYSGYKKSVHGDKKSFYKTILRLFQEDKRLAVIRGDIAFSYFLSERLGVPIKSDLLCGEDEDETFFLKRNNDPIYKALKTLEGRIDRSVYIESFGGDGNYKRFIDNPLDEGVFNPPFFSAWTKFCFAKNKFWLTQIGTVWANHLAERRAALNAAFAKGNLSLTDAVTLSNWYIKNIRGHGMLQIDAAGASLKKTVDGYELYDKKGLGTVLFDTKHKVIKSASSISYSE
jgi:hypothetical protein